MYELKLEYCSILRMNVRFGSLLGKPL